MASTKKQEKTSTVPDQTAPTPGDPNVGVSSSSSDGSNADAATGSTATTAPGAGADGIPETGRPVTDQSLGLAAVATSTESAASAGASPTQPGQTNGALETAAGAAGLHEPSSSASVELNLTQVEVYPLRSFMDEGELRRRGGPSYLVPRRHAEDLELRKLVSRQPLKE